MLSDIHNLKVVIRNRDTQEVIAVVKDNEMAWEIINSTLSGNYESIPFDEMEALRVINCSGLSVDYKGDLFEAVYAGYDEIIELLVEGNAQKALNKLREDY